MFCTTKDTDHSSGNDLKIAFIGCLILYIIASYVPTVSTMTDWNQS